LTRFVHLHNHSEYSLLDAIARMDDITARCGELGFDAYALTDHGVMYGAMEFYTAMRKANLKPIIGCEVYVAARKLTDKDPELDRRATHLVLLAMNREGYVNLMHLCSIAATEGFYYKPRVDVPTIMEHNAGLVALTACPGGVVAAPFHREGEQAANDAIERYLRIFGEERLFLEIQNHGIDIEENYRPWAADAARKHGLRLVATNDCHYVLEGNARAHDIALCLRDKKLLTDADRKVYSGPEYYIKSQEEMAALFAEYPEALENTGVVADMCELELDLDRVHFPRLTITSDQTRVLAAWAEQNPVQAGAGAKPGSTSNASELTAAIAANQDVAELASTDETRVVFETQLRHLAYEGAIQRYNKITDELAERIESELSVIIQEGFTTYFLICAEFCSYARSQEIPIGPGRGSSAASVVAYCLEITDLDPIKYGLYFERFLNPERKELPDFDIDFCYRHRDDVIDHVRERYGTDRTAQIITYSRLKARAVIKAVGRTKGLEFQYVDRVTKEIHGLNPTIGDALKTNPQLRQLVASDAEIAELITDAQALEGIAAHHSVHAAGLVIAPEELWHFVPVQAQRDNDWLVTQYAMDAVPKTGLVKFDFLGLRNLTMIQDAVGYIREHEGIELDPRSFPDDDVDTFAMLRRGDSYGVFQFEASQVKRMLQEARPESMADLTAINAANRPGPLESGNTERYLQSRRSGNRGVSLWPSINEILAPTSGVLLFQEQVMEIARKLAGFSLGEADVLRKAMGKKNTDVMDTQRVRFMAGAAERGVGEREAAEIWAMMEKFAGYGFNKAHSACYAWIAYQTAYLKCHYAHYFMCAMLNSYMGNAAKLAEILAQCRKMGITVLPPTINAGVREFTPTEDGRIVFGLGGIKGLGAAAVEAIVAERQRGGPFKSTAGFTKRTKGKGVNKKVLQSLAVAGAFDCLDTDRTELIKNLDDIEAYLRGPSKQEALFGGFDDGGAPGATPSREITALDVAMLEKAAVGVFLTHHPFENHPMYSDPRYLQLAELQESVEDSPQRWADTSLARPGLAGLLTEVNVRMSRAKQLYAEARLEDPERSVRLIIWPKTYEQSQALISENAPVVVLGKAQFPESVEETGAVWDSLEIIVDRVSPYMCPASDPGEMARQAAAVVPDEPAKPGNGSSDVTASTIESDESNEFSPLPITIKVELTQATKRQLARFANALERTKGERGVRMELHEVAGDVRQIKHMRLDRRFCISTDASEELAQEFPFVTFIDLPPDGPHPPA
jgi:DNA polymerase-3 subunit alpha